MSVAPTPTRKPTPTPLPTLTLAPPPFFTATGSMRTNRDDATATLLNDGKVLIAGGTFESVPLATAELYDPETGAFTPTGSMTETRAGHTATLLQDGRVLIAGGSDYHAGPGVYDSAETYDPATGRFTKTRPMTTARDSHTATLLKNGLVLLASGISNDGYLATAELFNPTTNTFTATGSMKAARALASATLLQDGRVLIAGGRISDAPSEEGDILKSAEIYNPNTGEFTSAGSMTYRRSSFAATLLRNGLVLVAGGDNVTADGGMLTTAELYDPSTNKWTETGSMAGSRAEMTATLLLDGRVLVVGLGAELYDPAIGKFSSAAEMKENRIRQTATLLPDGRVLIAGGASNTAELYWP